MVQVERLESREFFIVMRESGCEAPLGLKQVRSPQSHPDLCELGRLKQLQIISEGEE